MKPRYGHPSDPSRRMDVTQRVAAFMNGHENVGSPGSGSVACIWAMASPVHTCPTVQAHDCDELSSRVPERS